MKHQITTDLANLDASRARLAQDIATIAGEAADLLKNASGHNLRRAQEALTRAHAAIRSGSSDAAEATGDYVDAHPWQAIGLAAFVGVLAGVLFARR
jgi:ElaB/YqjD/DUF883 family membrane-anchored ribosome-binding protein